MSEKEPTEQELLEMAMKICIKHGKLPVDISTIDDLVATYDLVKQATEAIIRIQPVFSLAMQGQLIDHEAAKRNYESIEEIKTFLAGQKVKYQQVRDSVAQLKKLIS